MSLCKSERAWVDSIDQAGTIIQFEILASALDSTNHLDAVHCRQYVSPLLKSLGT